MAKAYLSIGFAILIPILFGIAFLSSFSPPVFSATDHIVISELLIGKTGASTDEFIELYNPTNSDIDLQNCKLSKKTKNGDESVLVSSLSGIIPAHGYFLITHVNSSESSSADMTYTGTGIADDNTVILYNAGGTTPLDELGINDAGESETSPAAYPATTTSGKSIERKAKSASTPDTMKIGGIDETEGNGEDTNNNTNDFISRAYPQPQNSNSETEPPIIPSPTPTLTGTPNTPTLTPTPTITSTPTSTPTTTLTPTPTPSPTATPTPTNTLTPTSTPTLTVSPTNSPTPTYTGKPNPFPRPHISFVCNMTYRIIQTRFLTIRFPQIRCHMVRS